MCLMDSIMANALGGGSGSSGGGLPVVELGAVFTNSLTEVTEEESARLTEVATTGLPFVVRAKVYLENADDGYMLLTAVLNRLGLGDIPIYACTVNTSFISCNFYLANEGVWQASGTITLSE